MNNDQKWVIIREVSGDFIAENLRALLEAQGVPVVLNQEGAGRALGLSVGLMGVTQILVPDDYQEQALKVLESYDRGDFADSSQNEA